eukprot:CAMPEP_0179199674 /NCGR_PEP_ID=MMETSP0796-20121207/99347_1 /TAXON_ID=73915 /ORGANISM="Pyrodinium bahamense, Strain pbaha01" /LENGTH=53 /DNA_ID=CAMNT_0020904183 /DNA_START=10 /DNA_END=168 /DNA_ORIENTATION=-
MTSPNAVFDALDPSNDKEWLKVFARVGRSTIFKEAMAPVANMRCALEQAVRLA